MNSLVEELRGNYAFPIHAVNRNPTLKTRPELRDRKISNMDRFYNLHQKGFTCDQIAKRLGFNLKTVQRYLRWRRLATGH